MGSLELSQKRGGAQKRGLHFSGGASEDNSSLWGFVKRSHCPNSEELPNSFFYLCFGVYCESILSL